MTDTPKRGRPRDPDKLALILAGLSGDPDMFCEYGTPPYSVAHLAQRLNMDPSNLRVSLLALERDGLVIRELRAIPVWNAIARNDRDRVCLCFWHAETMVRDQAAADNWRAGSSVRSENAFASIFGNHNTPA